MQVIYLRKCLFLQLLVQKDRVQVSEKLRQRGVTDLVLGRMNMHPRKDLGGGRPIQAAECISEAPLFLRPRHQHKVYR